VASAPSPTTLTSSVRSIDVSNRLREAVVAFAPSRSPSQARSRDFSLRSSGVPAVWD
jgi:hypothetical protein